MALLDKFNALRQASAAVISDIGLLPFGVGFDAILSPTEAVWRGRRVVMLGSNNYLGMTHDPDCVDTARRALDDWGRGSTGARPASGTFSLHRALEQDIAAFFGVDHAMLFTTGYQANLGIIGTLCGHGDTVVLDRDSHASIYDGARLSGATVRRFQHNDVGSLRQILESLGPDRASNCLVAVESLYSMLGDLAPLTEIAAICREHGSLLLVDEAHSLGVFGPSGAGLVKAEGLMDSVDFLVGTFSKSLGTIGGFCATRHDIEALRVAARPYLFSASAPPSVIEGARTALARMEAMDAERARLLANADRLRHGLAALGLRVTAGTGPIVAVMLDNLVETTCFWRDLLEEGVYANCMVPPATPGGVFLIRCSVSASHDDSQLAEVLAAFGRALERRRSVSDAAATVAR